MREVSTVAVEQNGGNLRTVGLQIRQWRAMPGGWISGWLAHQISIKKTMDVQGFAVIKSS